MVDSEENVREARRDRVEEERQVHRELGTV
jgi:hypothetical protein